MNRPIIGVTAPARKVQHAWWFTRRALRLAGATARLLTPNVGSDAFRGLDGIVLGGGSDIDPARYRQEPTVESKYDPARDAFELKALDDAVEYGLPVLGICRGAQLLNVFLGGTLHQDLQVSIPGFRSRRMVFARKTILIENATRLHGIMRTERLRVNSLHKQGVDKLGDGLRVAARDDLGVVQAIESTGDWGRFVVGVQWHPEYLLGSVGQQRLFAGLVSAAVPADEVSEPGGTREDPPPAKLPGRRSTPVEPPKKAPPGMEPARDTPPPAKPPTDKPPAKTAS